MFDTLKNSLTEPTQQEQAPGTVKNNAGGYVFAIDKFQQLRRFLILGTTGGTYYAGEKELTKENLTVVRECVAEDPVKTLEIVKEISVNGNAPNNDPALFVLALLLSGKQASLAYDSIPEIARTFTHLSHLLTFIRKGKMRGWGRGFRRAVANWYSSKSIDNLSYSAIKYKSRDGFSQEDVLRLVHFGSFLTPDQRIAMQDVFHYLGYTKNKETVDYANAKINAVMQLQNLAKVDESERPKDFIAHVTRLVELERLPMEAIPTNLRSKEVYSQLCQNPNMGWLIRNLGNLGKHELLVNGNSEFNNKIAALLRNEDHIKASKIHPLQIFVALNQYKQGRSDKGNGQWSVVPQIMDALTDAYHLAFKFVEPSNKKILLAVDVSGSMSGANVQIGGTQLPLFSVAGIMALSVANVEPNYHAIAFDHEGHTRGVGKGFNSPLLGVYDLAISGRQRLDDVARILGTFRGGGTDTALPFKFALKNKLDVDLFLTFTDNETWAGNRHIYSAMEEYRKKVNPEAKAINVAMTANRFTTHDTNPLNLEIVGFDSSIPQIVSLFAK